MSLDSFNAWMAANPEWLGLAIFLIAFLECAAIVGIVLPGVVLLFGVAVIAGSGALSLGETLLLAYAGGVLGDLSSYWIGAASTRTSAACPACAAIRSGSPPPRCTSSATVSPAC